MLRRDKNTIKSKPITVLRVLHVSREMNSTKEIVSIQRLRRSYRWLISFMISSDIQRFCMVPIIE